MPTASSYIVPQNSKMSNHLNNNTNNCPKSFKLKGVQETWTESKATRMGCPILLGSSPEPQGWSCQARARRRHRAKNSNPKTGKLPASWWLNRCSLWLTLTALAPIIASWSSNNKFKRMVARRLFNRMAQSRIQQSSNSFWRRSWRAGRHNNWRWGWRRNSKLSILIIARIVNYVFTFS